MKKLFLFVLMIYRAGLCAEPLSCNINAESAILMNADTGTILFEKKSDKLLYPASITKIATVAYVLSKYADQLNVMIAAEQDAVGSVTEEKKRRSKYTLPSYLLVTDCSHIGIKKGEEMSLRDLLYGAMVASADDACNVIAMHISGTVPKFMDEINEYLKKVGCRNTYFNNPHGLHHPDHQTTAYDMAVLTREAMRDPIFRQIVSTVRYPRPKTNKQESTTMLQTNRLLRKGKLHYEKAIGVKTGHTSAAGYNLVSAAKDGDRTLIAVVLKCKDRNDVFNDSIALFETAFNQPKVRRILLKAGPQKFQLELPGASKAVRTLTREDILLEYYPAEEPTVKSFLYWTATVPPISKGQSVGELRIQREDGSLVQLVPLLAQEDVSASWWWTVKQLFRGGKAFWKWFAVGVAALFFIGLLFQLGKK